jgi:hypothetical protein
LPSQSPRPGSQLVMWQVPPEQEVVAPGALQVTPQEPQSLRVSREVSQPSESTLLQSSHRELQLCMWQTSPEQEAVACAREQVVPQEPQSERESKEFSQPLEWVPSQLPQPELQLEMRHWPVAQVSDALARLQVIPQPPQSESVVREVSQPLASFPSQFPQPESQLAMWQLPPEQEAVACARLQGVPQEPQLDSVSREVSQPLAWLPSQLPHKESQLTMRHWPVAQDSLAWARLQVFPQPPQLESVVRSVSQPLEWVPSQLPQSESQLVMRQLPVEHSSPACGSEQAVPQEPQLLRVVSVCSQPLESWPSQSPHSESQLPMWQEPPTQEGVAFARLQVVPQEPQSVNVSREVSQPSEAVPLQSSHSESQLPTWQEPPVQSAVACGRPQGVLQEPQSVSVSREVSQPSESTPLQLSHSESQLWMWQVSPEQEGVAWSRSQVTPQAPQFCSESRVFSQPLVTTPSQSPQPGSQSAIWQIPPAQDISAPG